MHSLEPELVRLRDDAILDDATAARLIAVERREVFSVHAELRFLAWAGVMLIAGGVGVIVSKHYKDIGPLALATLIALAAAGCYAYAWWKRTREASLIDDYVLLLASLLVSADVGFLEHELNLLGDHWPRHFLLLAVVHGVVAYLFDSRMVLSLSLAALAAWFGVDRNINLLWSSQARTGVHALVCAALVLAWYFVDRKLRKNRSFEPVFEHFAANLAFIGAMILTIERDTTGIGFLLTVIFAGAAVFLGFRRRAESFVMYAWIYGTIALDAFLLHQLHDDTLEVLTVLVTSIAAIVGLIVTRSRFRAEAKA